ncbi:hypothetical protein [Maribacter halichondriae]|uniref:hypothetical protein n=1 Tax=Maribacter halichondriae TaxID=2980554 RepID=UPI00235881BA|nr:hypothetical protein [Maribacter sp. Hal144]
MKNKKIGSAIAFLLFALLLVKVSAFHVYTHHDSPTDELDNCKICHLVLETQSSEQQVEPVLSFDIAKIAVIGENPIIRENTVFTSFLLHYRLFGRPPPSIG